MTWSPGDDVIAVQRGPEPGGAGGVYRAFGETLRGLKTTFARIVEGPTTIQYPEEKVAGLPALPRPPPAAPLRGHRPGEVRRLLAVRRRLPGRLHPRRRGREHARAPRLAPASATPRSTRSTCRAASSAATARSRARSTRSRWATTTRCPTTTAPTSSSPRRCCSPSRSSARRCGPRASRSRRRVMAEVLFFIAAIGAIAGAIGVVALRNPFYSVLALVCHLLSLAALFLLLQRGVRRRRAGRRLRRRRDGALRLRRRLRRRAGRAAARRRRRRPAAASRSLLRAALFVEL